MRILLVSYFFPPAGTVRRPLKLAAHLAARGHEVHVLAPDDPKWIYVDDGAHVPDSVAVHRSRYLGPHARRLGDELYGKSGSAAALIQLRNLLPRLLVPDEFAPWLVTAAPSAIRIVRRERIDVVMTTSAPTSVHLIGALVTRATPARWVADVRDLVVANPMRRPDRRLQRLKYGADCAVERLVARHADVVVAASAAIAAELEALGAARIALVRNGCDFEDFDGLEYSPGERFRLTHTGSFYGERDPRPVLAAVASSGLDVTMRFAGDFRPRDRAEAERLGLGDRLELLGYVSSPRIHELQRASEALLLLIPNAGGRGRGVIPAKLFEYLAARRPILAAVPADGEAAGILREAGTGSIVDVDDVGAIREALGAMVERFDRGCLDPPDLSPELKERLSREARVTELEALLATIG